MQGESSLYSVPTNRDKPYSEKYDECRTIFDCYVKEDTSDPEVKIAAEVALKEYLQESKIGFKNLAVDKVIDAKRQVIGFLNRNHRLYFLVNARADCEKYSFFCSPPQKCKAEVNVRDNNYSVIKVECRPRVGKAPDQPRWVW